MPQPGSYREKQKRLVDRMVREAPLTPNRVFAERDAYARDPALCLTSVVFPPPELTRAIRRTLIQPLEASAPQHHCQSPEALHLTIKAVRTAHDPPTFTQADIARAQALYARVIPQHRAFSFSLEDVVVFAGSIHLIGYCDDRLDALVRALDCGLAEIGLPDDKRYASNEVYFGNITLARLVAPPDARLLEAVNALGHGRYGELPVAEVSLITCNAVCAPDSRRVWGTYRLGGR